MIKHDFHLVIHKIRLVSRNIHTLVLERTSNFYFYKKKHFPVRTFVFFSLCLIHLLKPKLFVKLKKIHLFLLFVAVF